ncbi:putative MFS-type transporter YhcA [Alicyclobacillus contaminans]|uniref:DHA2 family efflux MFS transporter permease subunit n=1 Tax=Alicyclobacillus contaminans TaxID=392016 RepID=UPI0004249F36|nr:DHA2 family efflux MFS transporter permease subunit [Alicyclobacillus contaminans]GMA51010.1 putative MFS-type transporter YhcA [Alicyclobacillus contaminans]
MSASAVSANQDSGSMHRGVIVTVMVLGAFVALLNQTLLNVAIPHLMNAFGVDADTVQWLSTAYMLTNGIVVPLSAFLIATLTTRTLFMGSVLIFVVGTLVCGAAPSFSVILAGRVIQAIGAGLMMPLMMTVIMSIYPPETRGKMMGVIGIAMFFAPALGPTLSGWMIENWSWRLLFYVTIPIGLLDFALAFVFLKNVGEPRRMKFDIVGFVTSTIGFGTLLYGFSEAGSKQLHDPQVVIPVICGIIFLVFFVVQELTYDAPMLNLRVFSVSQFSLATIVSSILNMAIFGGALLVPIYIQNIRGYSALESGLLMLPGALIMAAMSPISGILLDRYGVRPLAVIGLSITAVTTWLYTGLSMDTTYGHVMLLYTLRMFGMSFVAMTIMTSGLNALPRNLASHGTAVSNTVRMVASSLGTAILVTIMSTQSTTHFDAYADMMNVSNASLHNGFMEVAQSMAYQLKVPLSTGIGVAREIWAQLVQSNGTVEGIDDAFRVAAGLAVFALLLSFFLTRPKQQPVAQKARVQGAASPKETS